VGEKISRKKLDFAVQCGVPLHPEGSYTRYHTVKHYWRYGLNFKLLFHIVFV